VSATFRKLSCIYKHQRRFTDSQCRICCRFFDFYIIPLAKKLKDCGVFGVSSDEYLNYAMKNRQEWEERGEEVVAEMMEKVNKMKQERVGRMGNVSVQLLVKSGRSVEKRL
jgi:hypothetical protein